MFLVSEVRMQVVDEKMLVFINDLLSSGEIPDLFPIEDRDDIINSMRAETKAAGLLDSNENCWATFIKKVKENLHMVRCPACTIGATVFAQARAVCAYAFWGNRKLIQSKVTFICLVGASCQP